MYRLSKLLFMSLASLLLVACASNQIDSGDINELQRLAEKGNPEAQYKLAWLYEDEESPHYNLELAYQWYKKSAEQGNSSAQEALGWMYEDYLSSYQDTEKAMYWYEKAAQQGDMRAQVSFALLKSYHTDNGPPERDVAMKWMLEAANQGSIAAYLHLGRFYREGVITPQNYFKAYQFYSMAAKDGNAKALNDLGEMYLNGEGVTANRERAVALFKQSADKGNYEGESNYLRLTAVTLEEHHRRAKLGDPNSQLSLCYAYASGDGVDLDLEEGAKWCGKSAQQGNFEAQLSIARMYMSGVGVPEDLKTAYTWARIASLNEEDDARSVQELVTLTNYLESRLTKAEIEEIERTYNLCAKNGTCRVPMPLSLM
ncbi:tetratricopeptide repeat protein [Vibrio bivalvicida]|uniref:Tetratricopeptide repeat protein n=1 Tax=Vibrio bivalvicida TaxID=1276888 RepID=A0ABV4MCR6_9VIBR